MTALLRKYGLFYLTSSATFFMLNAYSLAANAPNYPFLPALFFPVYLSGAMAMSEKEDDDPLIGMLPVTPTDIMKVKFGLALTFVVIGWLHMNLFAVLQGLSAEFMSQVVKLNTISSINTLLLAAIFQVCIDFFGWSAVQKIIIMFTVAGGMFCIVFFIGVAESGITDPGMFPLVNILDSIPFVLLLIAGAGATVVYVQIFRRMPWGMTVER
jgi:hypothetical protein